MDKAIGLIELSSIAAGFDVEDSMIKAASVQILMARTICSGKFAVVIGGDVAGVSAAMEAGKKSAAGFLIDSLIIPNVHEKIFPALSSTVDLPEGHPNALGIVETFTVASIIRGADAAAKAAEVLLYRIHMAMAIGGKGFFLLCGDVGSVKAAVQAALVEIMEEGTLVHSVVIPSASPELFRDYI